MGRRLGQHFLFDPSILARIADAIDPEPDDVVLEIGAGKGTLTRALASRVGRVVAVEKDGELVAALRGESDAPLPANVTVVEGDALRLDWLELAGPAQADLKIAGNIPYSITSPLIDKALGPPLPRVLVFLVQREVAQRIAAAPGGKAYGALSVGVQAVARVERLFDVPAGAFRPPPKVDSAAVRLVPLDEPVVRDPDRSAFRRFVAALFGRRRKQILGALSAITGSGRDRVESCLAAAGVDPRARGETLSVETIALLFRELGR